MKFLGLVVVLVFIHCCAAQTNRSSVWLLANTQIFTTESPNPQSCIITVATGGVASSPVTLFTTSNLAITGTFIQLGRGTPGTTGFVTTTTAGSNSILYTVSIQFIYNSTYSITLAIPAQTINTVTPPTLSVSTLQTSAWWTSTVGSATSTVYPVILSGNTILSPTGSTWLRFYDIPSIYKASVTDTDGTVGTPYTISPASSGIIITDFVSSSTIAISLWSDNVVPAADATLGRYNGFYQLGVRTKTSTISSSTSVLKGATSCTLFTGRKRSIDHLINKRTAFTTCTTSSIDPSMTSSVLSTVCTRLDASHDATGTATQTESDLGDAFNKGVTAMNALYQADYAVFGAGSSKFAIAGNFGILIALSSIIFSLLN